MEQKGIMIHVSNACRRPSLEADFRLASLGRLSRKSKIKYFVLHGFLLKRAVCRVQSSDLGTKLSASVRPARAAVRNAIRRKNIENHCDLAF